MEYNIQTHHNKESRGKKIAKIFAWIILILIMMAASFGAGLYFPGKSEAMKDLAKKDYAYTGKIKGLYCKYKNFTLESAGYTTDFCEDIKDRLNKLAQNQDISFDLFFDTWKTLKENFVNKDKLNEKEMFYGALKGMVEATKDPYTVFMDPKSAQEFAESFSGTFEGIGAEIGIRNEIVTIITPLPDSPAQKSGLKPGDKIYAINGESTAGISIEEAVRKIRGPKNTEVTLTISRDGMNQAKEIKLVRGVILLKSVITEARADKIFIIRITSFSDDTSTLFNSAVNDAIKFNPKGIILDLRNNPGGYLETAVEMASEWISEGAVVTEEFGDGRKNEFKASGRARLKDYPTIVLVNEGSASASEIVAGALKDSEKARLVGKKTFGKGSVQTVENLADGSSIKITVAKWLTPKGNNINEQGIKPDIEVDLTEEDFNKGLDPQMDKVIELLNNK